MDIQLLNRWFKKGYGSREMANFLLLDEVIGLTRVHGMSRAESIEIRWSELHKEVCKIIYKKGPSDGSSRGNMIEDDE